MLPRIAVIDLILWCLFGFGGVYGDTCETQNLGICNEHLYSSKVFEIGNFPSVEQINSACPSITEFLNCIQENKCYLHFKMFSSEEEFVKVQDFISDICSTNSALHKKYVEHEECLSSVSGNMTECAEASRNLYLDYAAYKKNHIPVRDEPYVTNNGLCVTNSYSVLCAVMKISRHCGPETYDLSVELVYRSNFLKLFCNRMELYDLQTSFMDFLGVDDEQRELMVPVFNP